MRHDIPRPDRKYDASFATVRWHLHKRPQKPGVTLLSDGMCVTKSYGTAAIRARNTSSKKVRIGTTSIHTDIVSHHDVVAARQEMITKVTCTSLDAKPSAKFLPQSRRCTHVRQRSKFWDFAQAICSAGVVPRLASVHHDRRRIELGSTPQ